MYHFSCFSVNFLFQERVLEGTFKSNSIAVQQELDDLRENAAELKQVKGHLHDIKKTKGHTKEYRFTENEHDTTEVRQISKQIPY